MCDSNLIWSSPRRGSSARAVWGTLLLLAAVAASGCGVKNVVVENTFPVPIVQKHPQTVGLLLDEKLRNYSHAEELPGGSDWNIDLGAANVALFQQVFAGMFSQVVPVSNTKAPGGVDAVIQPVIQDFQFSTPDQNQTDFFEAWFKYKITVFDAQGRAIADWPLTAYGRSEALFLNKEESLRDAAQVAMRDAATAIVLEFDQQPDIRAFLQGKQPSPAVATQVDSTDAP